MKFRISLLLVLVTVLAFGTTFRASAQGSDCPYTADECALLEAATANAASLTSFYMTYTINLSTSGIPDDQNIQFDLQAEGPFDASGVAAAADPMTGLAGLVMANTMTGSVNAAGEETAGTFEFRVVEGALYFQGDLATSGQWLKIDLATLIQAGMSQMGSMGGGMGGMMDPTAAASPNCSRLW